MKLYARYALTYVLWAVSIAFGAGVGLLARDAVMNALAIGSRCSLPRTGSTSCWRGSPG